VALLGPGYDGEHATNLQKTAAELGIADQLHIFEAVETHEVPATISSADFGYIGFDDSKLNFLYALPNKFFEYVTAQIPLAVPDYPDMGSLVRKYDMGVTFHEVKPNDIASSLNALFTDFDRYQENVVAASEELTWANEAEKYRAVIEEQAEKATEKRPAFEWIDGNRSSVESTKPQ
jgi:hypothetical protein